MTIRTITCAILLAVVPAAAALAHPGHVAADGFGHTHWLAIAAVAGIAGIGATAWLRRRSGRPVARDRKI
jgi:hypothetical protein